MSDTLSGWFTCKLSSEQNVYGVNEEEFAKQLASLYKDFESRGYEVVSVTPITKTLTLQSKQFSSITYTSGAAVVAKKK